MYVKHRHSVALQYIVVIFCECSKPFYTFLYSQSYIYSFKKLLKIVLLTPRLLCLALQHLYVLVGRRLPIADSKVKRKINICKEKVEESEKLLLQIIDFYFSLTLNYKFTTKMTTKYTEVRTFH